MPVTWARSDRTAGVPTWPGGASCVRSDRLEGLRPLPRRTPGENLSDQYFGAFCLDVRTRTFCQRGFPSNH